MIRDPITNRVTCARCKGCGEAVSPRVARLTLHLKSCLRPTPPNSQHESEETICSSKPSAVCDLVSETSELSPAVPQKKRRVMKLEHYYPAKITSKEVHAIQRALVCWVCSKQISFRALEDEWIKRALELARPGAKADKLPCRILGKWRLQALF